MKWAAPPAGTGTVTSVSGSGGTTGLTLTGGPITASGTLTLGGTLAQGSGGTGTTTAFTLGSVIFATTAGVYLQDNANFFYDATNHRLGLGVTSPATTLELAGVNTTNNIIKAGTLEFGNYTVANSWMVDNLYYNGSAWTYRATGFGARIQLINGAINFGIAPSGSGAATVTDILSVAATGRVGIGTLAPATMLDISSTAPSFQMTDTTASAKSLRVVTDANLTSFYEAAGAAGDILTLDLANKRIGIKTAAPASPLAVAGVIESTTGGFKFPDATTQTSAASSAIVTTKGDLLTFDTAANRIPVGTNAYVLTADSTQSLGLKWAAPAASPTTTKGDISTYSTDHDRLPVGADGKVLTASSAASTGLVWAGGWVQISKITTAASQATVDFTSIPATYTDLIVVFQARDNYVGTTEGMYLKVNNDGTSGNYSNGIYILNSASTVSGGGVVPSASGMFIYNLPGTTATANMASAGKVTVANYAGTTFNKKISADGAYSQSGADTVLMTVAANWKSTAAITRLTFIVATSFLNGSVFTLYGVGTP
jgi:hypothetical protein